MKKINTTVYRLPGAGFAEKDGTFVNSARWLQWKYVAVPPPGQAKVDQEILARIFLKSARSLQNGRRQVSGSDLESEVALHNSARIRLSRKSQRRLTEERWPTYRRANVSGQTIKAGQQVPGFAWLRDDGTTACGNWLYSGSWTEAGSRRCSGGTRMIHRASESYPNWAWSWPANRRVMYNRASCDPSGKPWDRSGVRFGGMRHETEVGGQRRARFQGRFESKGSHGPIHHESRRRRTNLRASRGFRRWTIS